MNGAPTEFTHPTKKHAPTPRNVMELFVKPLNQRIEVQSGQNLLDVLRASLVPISYSCMSGRCGTCRCRVLEGSVISGGPESGRPIVDGDSEILACQTTLTQSCVIEVPEVDEVIVHPARIIKATVIAIEEPTHDIRRLRLRLAKKLEFTPGQYATLQFTPDHIRPYSMAGLPEDGEAEFHIRRVPDGRVTDYVFENLQEGASVRISGPLGAAYLRRKHEGPMLCVGGGTGLAPVLSIVRGALESGMRNPIHLYFGVRSERDLYDEQRLAALCDQYPNLKVQIVIATGAVAPGHRQGLVTEAVQKDLGNLDGWRAYVCGAPVMVEALNLSLASMGLAQKYIHADAFYPSAV